VFAAAAPAPGVLLKAYPLTTSSIQVEGFIPDQPGNGCYYTGQEIRYTSATTGITSQNYGSLPLALGITRPVPGAVMGFAITSLRANTGYYFARKLKDSCGGTSVMSNVVYSKTASGQKITLAWDASIDAPYLKSYVLYYYTTSGNRSSLSTTDYAVSYMLVGGSTTTIRSTYPRPITMDKSNLQITLNFNNNKTYYFVLTAVDTSGLESDPTPELASVK